MRHAMTRQTDAGRELSYLVGFSSILHGDAYQVEAERDTVTRGR